jgi:hypothetical protein
VLPGQFSRVRATGIVLYRQESTARTVQPGQDGQGGSQRTGQRVEWRVGAVDWDDGVECYGGGVDSGVWGWDGDMGVT